MFTYKSLIPLFTCSKRMYFEEPPQIRVSKYPINFKGIITFVQNFDVQLKQTKY